ncbi:hypothetical protein [uncultured Ruegeria sp.]|nr:hypothetical protein [uncultured Ruegeria sp.]
MTGTPTLLDEEGVWQILLENSDVFEAQATAARRKTFDDVSRGIPV